MLFLTLRFVALPNQISRRRNTTKPKTNTDRQSVKAIQRQTKIPSVRLPTDIARDCSVLAVKHREDRMSQCIFYKSSS